MPKKKPVKTKASDAKPAPYFQSIAMKLQQYWVDCGCLLWHPHNQQVGAGTMNPATFLRVLGPEPWNVVYLEPSVRPDDGRFGENPNRIQQHYQIQVILKPDPGNPQDLYLRSLQAIGIDVHKHDVRFVEDNWSSPALGAWGLGWEVWLDGLEITQFTYFQQAGGISLDPVSVELTYGLDRIAMALQGVQFVGDLHWSKQRSWGDLNLQGEREQSKYYFEVADVDRLHKMYDLYEEESKSALAAGLLLPAHDYVLRSSHTFNVLDARGAIGVTERQAYFRRMRALSSKVAEAYLVERQRQEFPWLEDATVGADQRPAPSSLKKKILGPATASDFMLEIGTEELPPADLDSAIEQLHAAFAQLLVEFHLQHLGVKVLGTPRRLVVQVGKLAARQPDRTQMIKGPPAAWAFTADGMPTPAAEGFAKAQGIPVSALKVEEMDGGKYAVASIHQKGLSAAELMAAQLPELIASLHFDQSMRWNASGVAFSRPIRWLLALHGETAIPFEYAGVSSGKTSRALRGAKPESFAPQSTKDYFAKLKKQGILLDPTERKAVIRSQIEKLAKAAGGRVPTDDELLAEVTNLVESPHALCGEFDRDFLELPREVLVEVMKKHQRYFPIEKNGKLLNAFIAVANGPIDLKTVAAGNADVLRARFADAAYFIKRDREYPLENYIEKLKQLTFQKELGSMGDKAYRIGALTKELSAKLGLSSEEGKTVERTALLCKADLTTKMVVDMTSLQGVMGKYYALDSGEKPEVADAIFEHYLPRFAGDVTPKSKAGLVIGLADRLDTLTGLFGVGLAPTGTKDPFAQRRAAIGLVQNLITWKLDFDLQEAIGWAAAGQQVLVKPEPQQETLDFIIGRLRAFLIEQGERYDVVDAVLAMQGHNPAGAALAVKELGAHVARKDWPQTLAAYSRCVRITRDVKENYKVEEAALTEEAENALFTVLKQAQSVSRKPGSIDDFIAAFIPMIPAINTFFDKVLVMSEDETLRRNRLGLLQRIVALADGVADFSKLEGF